MLRVLNQDELERERTAILRKSETLISHGFYYGQLLFIIFINDLPFNEALFCWWLDQQKCLRIYEKF